MSGVIVISFVVFRFWFSFSSRSWSWFSYCVWSVCWSVLPSVKKEVLRIHLSNWKVAFFNVESVSCIRLVLYQFKTPTDLWTCGPTDLWIDRLTCGLIELWTSRPLDPPFYQTDWWLGREWNRCNHPGIFTCI